MIFSEEFERPWSMFPRAVGQSEQETEEDRSCLKNRTMCPWECSSPVTSEIIESREKRFHVRVVQLKEGDLRITGILLNGYNSYSLRIGANRV